MADKSKSLTCHEHKLCLTDGLDLKHMQGSKVSLAYLFVSVNFTGEIFEVILFKFENNNNT